MSDHRDRRAGRGPATIAELVDKALDPLTAKRGFVVGQLSRHWADIVGSRYAERSRPERIAWPRGPGPGTLVVRVEGPHALFFQHEVGQVVERVNASVGIGTIDRIRIVQGPVRAEAAPDRPKSRGLDTQEESRLSSLLDGVESDDLRHALDRLGRAIIGEGDKNS